MEFVKKVKEPQSIVIDGEEVRRYLLIFPEDDGTFSAHLSAVNDKEAGEFLVTAVEYLASIMGDMEELPLLSMLGQSIKAAMDKIVDIGASLHEKETRDEG